MDKDGAPLESTAPAIEGLGDRPPVRDPVGRALVRAHVRGALFDHEVAPVKIGRFHVLERVGCGGMGIVYAAYDPDLDRRIALKLVPAGDGETRTRLLAEAQALARLSHPNVVPIHDVELVDDQVAIVMEFIQGVTLREWAVTPRSWREVLDAYRQLGEGLASAHRAGLVHRDVKPDNAIIGADGRVRVVDFGLARPVTTREPGTGPDSTPVAIVSCRAGTPRYMAPEQADGGVVTAAADQYSFCESLREALGDAAPWLTPVLNRGTALDPAARFPSMADLLRALAHDPTVIRRRRIMAAAAAGLVGVIAIVAFYAGHVVDRGGHEDAPCSGGAREITAVWGPSQRDALVAQLANAGPYGATLAPRLGEELDGYATRWASSHRAACLTHRRGEQSAELLDRRMACLDRSRHALAAVVSLLDRAETTELAGAVVAVRALPDLDRCGDPQALLSALAPPPTLAAEVARLDGELERARVLIAAGRAAEARAAAEAHVADARRSGYRPVLARALLVLGRADMLLEPREQAIAPLREATALGFAISDHALAIEAYARRAWIEGAETHRRDPREILDGLAIVEALAGQLHDGAFVRALLYNNVGAVEWIAGRHDRARAAMDRALAAASEVPRPAPIELITIQGNLAYYVDDSARRAQVLAGAAAAFAAAVGDEHPMTLWARFKAGFLSGDPAAAAARMAPVCAAYQHLHPAYGGRIAECWFEVGLLADQRGDRDQAAAAFAAATAAHDVPPVQAALARGYLALVQGEPAAAERSFATVLAETPVDAATPSWVRVLASDAHLGRALARRASGDRRAAIAELAAAEALLVGALEPQRLPHVERRLARARADRAAMDRGGSPRE